MNHKTGCLICGKELAYSETLKLVPCFLCKAVHETNTTCIDQHYVCDACHSGSANDLIERYCINTTSTDPIALATILMREPVIKMHGPEHHFLVSAVLLAAYFNQKHTSIVEKAESIQKARKRAEDIKGGFCGFHGACGAAIGTGIFVSVLSKSTPLSSVEWRFSNLMTAESLRKIAENPGPRCCKRSSYIAIISAVGFLDREFGFEISIDQQPVCTFETLNKECHKESCDFFQIEKANQ